LNFKTLKIEKVGEHIFVLTLNRPEVRNALNLQMWGELKEFFSNFDLNAKPDPRVVIVTGDGDKAFCAGADLKERNQLTDKVWLERHKLVEGLGEAIGEFPLPLIAAVNGAAYGGGCELAMLCDFIVASETATFAQPEVKLGFIPGLQGTQRLPRIIGIARAKEMLFSGNAISAQQALDWGLVNHIVSPDKLLEKAQNIAELISANGPIAVRQVKRAVDLGMDHPLDEAIKIEIECYNIAVGTEDRREGVRAFNEKRLPKFENK
jgi:enoyl-CoA hydratase/carnithine racemase